MNFDIQTTPRFDKDVKRLQKRFPKIKQDLIALANDLLANPESGTPLGENFFKLRIANSSIPTGKSGGFCVITYYRHHPDRDPKGHRPRGAALVAACAK